MTLEFEQPTSGNTKPFSNDDVRHTSQDPSPTQPETIEEIDEDEDEDAIGESDEDDSDIDDEDMDEDEEENQ